MLIGANREGNSRQAHVRWWRVKLWGRVDKYLDFEEGRAVANCGYINRDEYRKILDIIDRRRGRRRQLRWGG